MLDVKNLIYEVSFKYRQLDLHVLVEPPAGLTDGVQPQAVGALAVDGVASHAAVPAAVVAADVGHVDDAGVALRKH